MDIFNVKVNVSPIVLFSIAASFYAASGSSLADTGLRDAATRVESAGDCVRSEFYVGDGPRLAEDELLQSFYLAAKRGDLATYLSLLSEDGSRQDQEQKLKENSDLLSLYKNVLSVKCLSKVVVGAMTLYDMVHHGKIQAPGRNEPIPINIPVLMIKVCGGGDCKFSTQFENSAAIRAYIRLIRDGNIKVFRDRLDMPVGTGGALVGRLPLLKGRTASAIQVQLPIEKLSVSDGLISDLQKIAPNLGSMKGGLRVQSKYGDRPSRLMPDALSAIGGGGLSVRIVGKFLLSGHASRWHLVGFVDALDSTIPQLLTVVCEKNGCIYASPNSADDADAFLQAFILEARIGG